MLKKRPALFIVKSVLFALILREMHSRFSKNRLGAFWFVFEPMAHVLILLLIFTTFRRYMPSVDMPLFLMHGIIPFLMYRNMALKGMEAVNSNRGLLAYRQVKPFDMVMARALVEILLMICVYALILAALGWFFDYDIIIHQPLQWLSVWIIGGLLAFGSALIFCVTIDALPELASMIRIMYMPLYILSGIIFPVWALPKDLLPFLLWNPYLHVIELLRDYSIAWYPRTHGVELAYPAACAIVVLFIGTGLYRARRLHLVAT